MLPYGISRPQPVMNKWRSNKWINACIQYFSTIFQKDYCDIEPFMHDTPISGEIQEAAQLQYDNISGKNVFAENIILSTRIVKFQDKHLKLQLVSTIRVFLPPFFSDIYICIHIPPKFFNQFCPFKYPFIYMGITKCSFPLWHIWTQCQRGHVQIRSLHQESLTEVVNYTWRCGPSFVVECMSDPVIA